MHEIDKKGLDIKTPYTSKQLSEQGYMCAVRTSTDAINDNFVEKNMMPTVEEEIPVSVVTVCEIPVKQEIVLVVKEKPVKVVKKEKEAVDKKKAKDKKVTSLKEKAKESLKKKPVSDEVKAEIKEIAEKMDVT